MKKFLTFLLIAIITCKTVKEMEDEELIKGIVSKIIKSLAEPVLKAIIEAKSLGEKAAEKVCCTLVPVVCSLCGLIVKAI